MRKLFLAALLFASLPVMAQPEVLLMDRVLAVIDDEVILQSEFQARYTQIIQQLPEERLALMSDEELNSQILDQLIIENLQMQMAYRAGIRVDDNILNQAMQNIAQQNNMTFDQFRGALEEQGVYAFTRLQVEREIVLGQLQNSAVNQRINVTRQEIENYLRSEAGISDIAPEFHVAHLLIPNSETAPAGGVEELANLLYTQLEDGANIVQMSAQGQISGIAISGGDLGWNKAETLPGIFSDIVPDLGPGEVAEPFTSESGYHIVQVLETRGGSDLQIDQTNIRHIMIAPNEIRTDAQAEEFIWQLYEEILDGADFADIARQNTDDPESMVSGGDLDWISQGQVPPEYMAVINETEIGVMTEPFRIPLGWYIVEVLDRRVEDVTEDNKRFQAQQLLRQRKFENELQNWLTEIRDIAYVDIKAE